jgi:hypothetical protein
MCTHGFQVLVPASDRPPACLLIGPSGRGREGRRNAPSLCLSFAPCQATPLPASPCPLGQRVLHAVALAASLTDPSLSNCSYVVANGCAESNGTVTAAPSDGSPSPSSPTTSPTSPPSLPPTSSKIAARPNFDASSSPTRLSERYAEAGFGVFDKSKPLNDAEPQDFTWLFNVSGCVSKLQHVQQAAISQARAAKTVVTDEELCGNQIQMLSAQECDEQGYAAFPLEWAVLSYEVELAPFRTGNAEVPTLYLGCRAANTMFRLMCAVCLCRPSVASSIDAR